VELDPEQAFDFDAWCNLAEADADAFEAARTRMLERYIANAPAHRRRRLAGLQWQVDLVRARAGNPLVACFRISDLMWEQLLGADGLVSHIAALDAAPGTPLPVARGVGEVLPFPPPSGAD
jgi:hypothetical protein